MATLTAAGYARLGATLRGEDESPLALSEAALVVATHAYPELDVDGYLARISDAAGRLRARLPADAGRQHMIGMLNHFMFDELGFSGSSKDYYDPRNSMLNDVLDRRLGIPITLSILYLEVGRAIGLPLSGVSFPGHFLVRCPMRGGIAVIDPYHGGISLSEEGLNTLLAQTKVAEAGFPLHVHLQPAGKREIIARLLRNLRRIYEDSGALERALEMADLILVATPDAPGEFRERAALYRKLECHAAALRDFERYLAKDPLAADEPAHRDTLSELRALAAKLH